MASAPGLTEAQIRAFALPETFARGREYFESGTVTHLTRRGAELQAEVEGSQYTPYQVHVTLAERGLAKAVCTCPYAESWEGACKHIVATLLACVHQPEQVEEHPPLDTVLAPLDRDQLHALVQGLVAWRWPLASRSGRCRPGWPPYATIPAWRITRLSRRWPGRAGRRSGTS